MNKYKIKRKIQNNKNKYFNYGLSCTFLYFNFGCKIFYYNLNIYYKTFLRKIIFNQSLFQFQKILNFLNQFVTIKLVDFYTLILLKLELILHIFPKCKFIQDLNLLDKIDNHINLAYSSSQVHLFCRFCIHHFIAYV